MAADTCKSDLYTTSKVTGAAFKRTFPGGIPNQWLAAFEYCSCQAHGAEKLTQHKAHVGQKLLIQVCT